MADRPSKDISQDELIQYLKNENVMKRYEALYKMVSEDDAPASDSANGTTLPESTPPATSSSAAKSSTSGSRGEREASHAALASTSKPPLTPNANHTGKGSSAVSGSPLTHTLKSVKESLAKLEERVMLPFGTPEESRESTPMRASTRTSSPALSMSFDTPSAHRTHHNLPSYSKSTPMREDHIIEAALSHSKGGGDDMKQRYMLLGKTFRMWDKGIGTQRWRKKLRSLKQEQQEALSRAGKSMEELVFNLQRSHEDQLRATQQEGEEQVKDVMKVNEEIFGKKLEELRDRCHDLATANNGMKEQLSAAEREALESRKRCDAAENNEMRWKAQVEEMRLTLKDQHERIVTLELLERQLQEDLGRALESEAELQQQVAELKHVNDRDRSEITRLQELSDAQRETLELGGEEMKIATLQRSFEQAKLALNDLSGDKKEDAAKFEAKIHDLEEENRGLRAQLRELSRSPSPEYVENTQRDLENKEADARWALQMQNESLEEQVSELKQQISSMESEREAFELHTKERLEAEMRYRQPDEDPAIEDVRLQERRRWESEFEKLRDESQVELERVRNEANDSIVEERNHFVDRVQMLDNVNRSLQEQLDIALQEKEDMVERALRSADSEVAKLKQKSDEFQSGERSFFAEKLQMLTLENKELQDKAREAEIAKDELEQLAERERCNESALADISQVTEEITLKLRKDVCRTLHRRNVWHYIRQWKHFTEFARGEAQRKEIEHLKETQKEQTDVLLSQMVQAHTASAEKQQNLLKAQMKNLDSIRRQSIARLIRSCVLKTSHSRLLHTIRVWREHAVRHVAGTRYQDSISKMVLSQGSILDKERKTMNHRTKVAEEANRLSNGILLERVLKAFAQSRIRRLWQVWKRSDSANKETQRMESMLSKMMAAHDEALGQQKKEFQGKSALLQEHARELRWKVKASHARLLIARLKHGFSQRTACAFRVWKVEVMRKVEAMHFEDMVGQMTSAHDTAFQRQKEVFANDQRELRRSSLTARSLALNKIVGFSQQGQLLRAFSKLKGFATASLLGNLSSQLKKKSAGAVLDMETIVSHLIRMKDGSASSEKSKLATPLLLEKSIQNLIRQRLKAATLVWKEAVGMNRQRLRKLDKKEILLSFLRNTTRHNELSVFRRWREATRNIVAAHVQCLEQVVKDLQVELIRLTQGSSTDQPIVPKVWWRWRLYAHDTAMARHFEVSRKKASETIHSLQLQVEQNVLTRTKLLAQVRELNAQVETLKDEKDDEMRQKIVNQRVLDEMIAAQQAQNSAQAKRRFTFFG